MRDRLLCAAGIASLTRLRATNPERQLRLLVPALASCEVPALSAQAREATEQARRTLDAVVQLGVTTSELLTECPTVQDIGAR